MATTPQHSEAVLARADCIFTGEQVDAALTVMAGAIERRIGGSNPLVVCVLTGALIPTGLLLPRLRFPLQVDYLHATRYGGETSGGELRWIVKPHHDLKDRVVLLVDDILDEGVTLAALQAYCRQQGAREVLSAVLVEKVHDRKHPSVSAEFVGLQVPDRYVFGTGMDYKGYLRNVAGIYAAQAQDE